MRAIVTTTDCISREAVTDTIICEGISCNECSFNTCEDGQSGCLLHERIRKLPSVQPEQKWIPVSERLPEEDGDYFVTLENGVVKILGYSTTQRTTYPKGFYYISNGFSWRQTINPVTAWMSLPKQYQTKEGE